MEARALLRHCRIAPRKLRVVADLIRGKDVEDAITLLEFTQRAAARPLRKLLQSAVSNAEEGGDLDVDRLRVMEIRVDQGPTLKRFRPRAQGRAFRINKRTSHVTVVVGYPD